MSMYFLLALTPVGVAPLFSTEVAIDTGGAGERQQCTVFDV